jgi:hypothetical protein
MKKMNFAGIILVVLLAVCGMASAFSPNLVLNGGFETPAVSNNNWLTYPDGYSDSTGALSWKVERGLGAPSSITPTLEIETYNTLGLVPAEGKQYAELDSNANANISQTINVQAGTTYAISFDQSCRSGDPQIGSKSKLGVFWGTAKLGQTTCSRSDVGTWAPHTYTVTATTTGPVKLMFADEGVSDSYGVLLDDVYVVGAPINAPEFPTLFLPATFLIGFLFTVLCIRRMN